jgi:hypothetical protein
MNVLAFVRRHPLASFFGLAYVVSLAVALALSGPALIGAPTLITGPVSLALFPLMVIRRCAS